MALQKDNSMSAELARFQNFEKLKDTEKKRIFAESVTRDKASNTTINASIKPQSL